MALEGKIKTPLGEIPKKQAAIGGALLAVILGVVWYRHRQAAAAANAGTTTAAASGTTAAATAATGLTSDPYPPDGTSGDPSDPNSVDPATGQTYGDEQAGYGGAGGYGYGDSGGGYYDGGGSGQPVPTGYTSNAQWAQAAEQYLTGNGGNAETIGNALGKYITGADVTAAQQEIIEQAIAFTGYPPVNGLGGYPPSIRLEGGPTTHKKTSRPTRAPSGLRSSAITASSATLGWDKVTTATSYELHYTEDTGAAVRNATDRKPGTTTKSVKVTGTSHRLAGLHAGTHHTWWVIAVNSGGQGPKSETASFTTPKAPLKKA